VGRYSLLSACESDLGLVTCTSGGDLPVVVSKTATKRPIRLIVPLPLPLPERCSGDGLELIYAFLTEQSPELVRWVSLLSVSSHGSMERLQKSGRHSRSTVERRTLGSLRLSVPTDVSSPTPRLVLALELGEERGEVEFLAFTLANQAGEVVASLGQFPRFADAEVATRTRAENMAVPPLQAPHVASEPGTAEPMPRQSSVVDGDEADLNGPQSGATEIDRKLDAILHALDLGRHGGSVPENSEVAKLIYLQERLHKDWRREQRELLAEMDDMRRLLDEAQLELATLRSKP
jgi:hypothetical protein